MSTVCSVTQMSTRYVIERFAPLLTPTATSVNVPAFPTTIGPGPGEAVTRTFIRVEARGPQGELVTIYDEYQ